MDAPISPPPKPPRSFNTFALVIGLVVALGVVGYSLFLAPAKPAKVEAFAAPRAGDIIPLAGTRWLTFANPDGMRNKRGEVFLFGDRCRAFDRGTFEVVSSDDARILVIYREARERPTDKMGDEDLNAESERLDCPNLSPIVLDHDEWNDLLRACRITGGSQDALRDWVREQLPSATPSH